MKKKIFAFIMLCSISIQSTVYAAGFPVIDFSHIFEAGLTHKDRLAQLKNTVSGVKDVYDQAKDVYDALEKVSSVISNYQKVKEIEDMADDIIYNLTDRGFNSLSETNYLSSTELASISIGYTKFIAEATKILTDDLAMGIIETGLHMSDAERLSIVDVCHAKMTQLHSLVSYYTNRHIAVCYIRSKAEHERKAVNKLFEGSENYKYW